ncbi:MAG TPA: hypothetical protein VMU52_00430 [Steroidobacteraceae bacterium]|nr:hypothetical protein [Steroidobacteraceae bacterium]
MLRILVLILGCIAAGAGAWCIGIGARGPGIYLVCVGTAIILGTAFERWRYRNAPPAGALWESTGERFEDPATGETLEVHYDRASGERRYVRTGESARGKP